MDVSYGKAQLNRRKGGVERIEDELVEEERVSGILEFMKTEVEALMGWLDWTQMHTGMRC